MSIDFTLRQLEYAVSAADHGNFGEAAKACHVSQPSLSAQLAQLEKTLGKKLFERGSRGVSPTPFGEAWIPEARRVLQNAKELTDLARAERPPLSGALRLGVIPTIAPFVLPATMPLLRERFPEARVYLVEDTTDALRERLQAGQLDVLLLALEADLGPLATMPLFRDALLLALPREHALARVPEATIADVPRDELLLLDEGHCLSEQVAAACKLAPDSDDFRASSLVTLVQMVAMGRGVTLLPRIATHSELVQGNNLVVRPLRDEAYRTIGLAWRNNSARHEEFELLGTLLEEASPKP